MAVRLLLWLSEAPVIPPIKRTAAGTFGNSQNILCPTGAPILPQWKRREKT
jgi:hypothetical protein